MSIKKKERKKEKKDKNKLTWPRLKPYTFAYEKRRYEHCARYAERYAKFCIKIHLMRIEKLKTCQFIISCAQLIHVPTLLISCPIS